jgi:hypothetical protein
VTGPDGGVTAALAAREAWQRVLDELLRGVAHALSNRVATVSAAAYMATGGEPLDATTAQALGAEAQRLEALLADLRALPARGDAPPEPLLLADAAREAIALHRHYLALRNVPVALTVAPGAPPTFGDGAQLAHLLLLALTALRSAWLAAHPEGGEAPADAVTLHVDGDEDWARCTAQLTMAGAAHGTAGRAEAAACAWLAAQAKGRAHVDAPLTRIVVELPSLRAVRRAREAPR